MRKQQGSQPKGDVSYLSSDFIVGSLASCNSYYTVCYHNLRVQSMQFRDSSAFRLYFTAFYVPIDVRFDVSLAAYILWLYASLKNLSSPSNSTLLSSLVMLTVHFVQMSHTKELKGQHRRGFYSPAVLYVFI